MSDSEDYKSLSGKIGWRLTGLLLSLGLLACQDSSQTIIYDDGLVNAHGFVWQLPQNVPPPAVPASNPMSQAKFELGRHLFFDARLSGNGTQSCSSCHKQELAFSDGLATAIGSTDEVHPRNSQSLVNVAYNATLTWANPSLLHLEQQIMVPLFGESPVEQGLNDTNLKAVLQRLQDEPLYQPLFEAAFPQADDYFTVDQIVSALASFVRGLTSFNSTYDQFLAGDRNALSASAQRGRRLFFSERMECFHCHGGYNFSDSTVDRSMSFIERPFHNTGLFNTDGQGAYPEDNQGIFAITEDPDDMGKFRAPSLRNIELTAPYMHDGSIESLEAVIDFYAAGGRLISSGPKAGDGRQSPLKDGFVTGFELTDTEKTDLLEFLKSLTDQSFITNESYANPWQP